MRETSSRLAWGLALAALATSALAQQTPPPLGAPPVPPANPQSAAKIALGKTLFWDEQLSLTGTVACGTCHRAQAAGSDPRSAVAGPLAVSAGPDGVTGTADDIVGSPGVPVHDAAGNYTGSPAFGLRPQVGTRKANAAINAAYAPQLFWDGRAAGQFRDPVTNQVLLQQGGALENQALGPLVNTLEMGHSGVQLGQVTTRLTTAKPLALASNVDPALSGWIAGRGYPALFGEVFGTAEVTPARLALAIASYERTLNANQAPIDSGAAALTNQELQGQQVFVANDCAACHAGSLFSDNQFHYIGVRPPADDPGRFAVTGDPDDQGSMRTPSLRGVAERAPYFHTGRFASLEAVVDFYIRGGDFNAPNKDPRVRPRNINAQQRAALLAFLRRPLSDPRVAAETAPFDRPTLYSESTRVPQITGTGRAGSGALVPQVTALEPPLLGSDNFTVVVSQALASANLQMVVSSEDPGVAAAVPVGDYANQAGSVSASGLASLQLALDPARLTPGQTLYLRVYVADPAASGGYAVTPAVRFTVFGDAPAVTDTVFAAGFE